MELLTALLIAAIVVALISRNWNPLKVCPAHKGADVLRSGVWSRHFRLCTWPLSASR